MTHTPRASRNPGRSGRLGTLPPVPGRPAPISPGPSWHRARDRGSGSGGFFWSAGALLLLVVLTWQTAVRGPLLKVDEQLGDMLRHSAPSGAELLADLGNMVVALPLLAAAAAYSWWRSRKRWHATAGWLPLLAYVLAMAAVPLCVSLLKAWLDRPGPLGGTGYYPSGHSATAAVAFGGAALLLAPLVRRRWPLPAVAVVLTVLNGAGLVWRGYHWPADVLASWCLGWLLLTTATAAARRALRRSGPPSPAGPADPALV